MRKYTLFFVCCLVSLFVAVIAFAQAGPRGQFGPGGGFTGPGAYPPPGGTGFGTPPPPSGPQGFGYGFTGPTQTVTAKQAQAYGHKTPVIIKGNIVQAIGGDMFQFRDSSGEIVLKIGPREWMYYGSTISPQDAIEISGEVCYGNGWEPVHVHARLMRKI